MYLLRSFSAWQYVLFVLTALSPVRVSTEKSTGRKHWRCCVVQLSFGSSELFHHLSLFGMTLDCRAGYQHIKNLKTESLILKWVSCACVNLYHTITLFL